MSKELEHLKMQLNTVTSLRAWIADEIAELEAPKTETWEPPPGDWWVTSNGEVQKGETLDWTRCNGTERKTERQAEEAAKRMRTFNRLDAWIDENIDGHVHCQVEFDGNCVAIMRYFPREEVAILEKLVDDGVVKF